MSGSLAYLLYSRRKIWKKWNLYNSLCFFTTNINVLSPKKILVCFGIIINLDKIKPDNAVEIIGPCSSFQCQNENIIYNLNIKIIYNLPNKNCFITKEKHEIAIPTYFVSNLKLWLIIVGCSTLCFFLKYKNFQKVRS